MNHDMLWRCIIWSGHDISCCRECCCHNCARSALLSHSRHLTLTASATLKAGSRQFATCSHIHARSHTVAPGSTHAQLQHGHDRSRPRWL